MCLNPHPCKPGSALDGGSGDVVTGFAKIRVHGYVIAGLTENPGLSVACPEDPDYVGFAASWADALGKAML